MSQDKPKEIAVSIDTKRTEELARENERLKIQQEEKLAKAEVERINFTDAKLDLAEKTGDDSFKEVKTKEELKEKLNSLLKEAVESRSRKTEVSGGSAPLNDAQLGNPVNLNDLPKLPFNADTVMYLQKLRQKGDNEASQILDDLWKKFVYGWRQSHQPISYSPDDNVPKTNGIPELNFDNYRATELSGFPQIKKSPLNYAKTHNPDGSKKEVR